MLFIFKNILCLLNIKKKTNILLFLFRKSQIFLFFLFNKKFIISHKKIKKTNNLKYESKLF